MIKINLIPVKKCKKCKRIKSLKQFYKNKNLKDGYLNCCKECHKKENIIIQKKYYQKIKEEFLSGKRKLVEGKICPKCSIYKKANKFCKSLTQPTGLTAYCNDCRNKYYKQRRGYKSPIYREKTYLQKQKSLGKTIKQIAQENNCSIQTIYHWTKKFNIKFINGNTKNPKNCSPNYYRKGYHKNGRKRNKISQWAINKLQKAIENGDIIRPPYCQICEKNHKKIEGHHPDYSKPLQVIWACSSCHRLIHLNHWDKVSDPEIIKEYLEIEKEIAYV